MRCIMCKPPQGLRENGVGKVYCLQFSILAVLFIPGGGCLKHISDTKDLFIAGAFKIHV